MFYYARADTHFLLFIYDHMRNELIDKTSPENPEEDRIEIVLQKSKETSLLRYERQVYNSDSGKGPGGWYALLVKSPALFSNEQFAVFKAVHGWRDKVARVDDDSTTFVMSQQVLFSIAKLMPVDIVSLLSIAHPVSHGMKSRAGELVDVIKGAKAQGRNGPSMIDILRPNPTGPSARSNVPEVSARPEEKILVATMDERELRSGNSTFWGNAFGSSIWDAPQTVRDENLRLAVPLPALLPEVFASGPAIKVLDVTLPPAQVIPIIEPKKAEAAFVIKRGSKRKSDAISEAEDSNSESPDSEKAVQVRQKAERKAARKAEKKAKKAAKKVEDVEAEGSNEISVDGDDVEEEEPFDYSKADSVLHGKKIDTTKEQKRKKPFDPYAKSVDAPKGMRRSQTERAGRSHTFKN
jgi:exosome complex exonuclease RRP6